MSSAKTSHRRQKRELREQMHLMGLDRRQIAAEFSRVYHLRPRAAWREAHGWSLQEAADKINCYSGNTGLDPGGLCGMTSAHLCEYESWPGNGDVPAGRKPSPYLLAVLAGIYDCHVSDLIDFADRKHLRRADLFIIDTYTKPPLSMRQIVRKQPAGEESEPLSPFSPISDTMLTGALVVGGLSDQQTENEEEVNVTRRRDFVALGAYSGLAITSETIRTLENEVDQIHITLDRGTTSEERVSHLEGIASDLGMQVVKVAPLAVLSPALNALQSIRRLLESRQPTRQQARLIRASAELCTVVGEIMFVTGQFREAREWYITAEHAACDIGDRYMADIALAGQGYLPTYSEDPNGVLALLVPRLEEGPSPSPAVAWLWAFAAKAHATLNQPADFELAIAHAQDCLERSSPDLVRPGIFSFLPEKLAFYEATGSVRLNDTGRALNAADRALAMYDLSDTTEPALAKLERAGALARSGEVAEACRVATATLLDRGTYHGVTVRTYASRFDKLVRDMNLPEANEWREVRAEVHGGQVGVTTADGHGS